MSNTWYHDDLYFTVHRTVGEVDVEMELALAVEVEIGYAGDRETPGTPHAMVALEVFAVVGHSPSNVPKRGDRKFTLTQDEARAIEKLAIEVMMDAAQSADEAAHEGR
jgi:hypothetical protein